MKKSKRDEDIFNIKNYALISSIFNQIVAVDGAGAVLMLSIVAKMRLQSPGSSTTRFIKR